jgi:hypothetical protein
LRVYVVNDPEGPRFCHLCREDDGEIRLWSVFCDPGESMPGGVTSVMGELRWNPDLLECEWVRYGRHFDNAKVAEMTVMLKERRDVATLMLRKFLVTLSASNTVRERGETRHRVVRFGRDPTSRREKDFKTVVYSYTHVRQPDDDALPFDGVHRHRKRHLVRGYTWGRHTRPPEEQRWIAPFWRGRGEVAVQRDHYEIRSA